MCRRFANCFTTLILALVVSVVTGQCVAQQSEKKEAAVLGVVVFPPHTIFDGESGCTGPYVDAAKTLFAPSPVELRIVCAPAARIYRMMATNEIDMTINVRSTQALIPHSDFFPKPFSYLQLALYKYQDAQTKSVSAIRAFDYNGQRQKLVEQGFRFIDVPTAEDAINMFFRQRSEYLISYAGPVDYFLNKQQGVMQRPLAKNEIEKIPTYIAINKTSSVKQTLSDWLTELTQQQSTPATLLDLAQSL